MVWILTSLGTAIVLTFANITDSHILSKKVPNVFSYLLVMSIFQILSAAIVFAFSPFSAAADVTHFLGAVGGGLANAFALVLLFNCLQKGEVSRVIPVTSSFPIFVALLSMPLLGEILNFWEWLAIFLTVAGAVLISLQRDSHKQKTRLQISFLLLLLTAFLFAVSNIGFKYAMEAKTISFWNVFTVNGICCAVIALLFSARKSTLLELKNLRQRTQKIGLIFGSQSIAALGITLSFIAIGSGPVALVSTIMNIRPAFVFIFSIIISRFYPGFINERLTKGTIIVKLIGIAMITGGVAIISLSS